MAFDWLKFVKTRGIAFSDQGRNVGRDHIVVRCPMCGSADESMHMEIHLGGRGWKCFKNSKHSGRKATALVKALLQISYEAAAVITNERLFLPDDWNAHMKKLMASAKPTPRKPLEMPKEFKRFGSGKQSEQIFRNYLIKRNFKPRQIDRLTDDFDIRYASAGTYQGRVMFPVFYNGRLVSWTGRAVHDRTIPKYKTLSKDPHPEDRTAPVALGPISNYLLWYDKIRDAKLHTFVLVEGPFDALKINVLGWRKGICASACTTAQPSKSQIDLLHDLLPKFKRRVLMLDRGTQSAHLYVNKLIQFDMEIIDLRDHKDPGEFIDLEVLR